MSLYRRKDSPFYWSSLFIGGIRRSQSTGERTQARALRRERDFAADLEREARASQRLTLGSCCVLLLEAKEADGHTRAGTIKMLRQHVKRIGAHFGADADVRSIDATAVKAWMATRKVAAVTLSKELSTLRQVLGIALAAGTIDKVPVPKGPRVPLSTKAWRILARDELGRILDELSSGRSGEAAAWYIVAAQSGMRPSEQARLAWEWIDRRAGVIRLPESATKNGRARDVDLTPTMLVALDYVQASHGGDAVGRVWWQTTYRTAWERACERAKVGHVRPYDLRHTFASLLHADGAPLVVVRDALGHVTLTMVNHYAHSFDGQRREHVARAGVAPSVAIQGRNVARKGPKQPEPNVAKGA